MKLKPKPFNDGICQVFTVDKRRIKECLGIFNFKEETVGIKAFSEMHVLGFEIERVISIPFNPIVDKSRVVKIGSTYYEISLIQVKDTFPKSLRMTLTKTPLKWSDRND